MKKMVTQKIPGTRMLILNFRAGKLNGQLKIKTVLKLDWGRLQLLHKVNNYSLIERFISIPNESLLMIKFEWKIFYGSLKT